MAELGRKGLVVGDDQGGTLDLLDDACHGEGLAGPGNAEQRLVLQAAFKTLAPIPRWLRAGLRLADSLLLS